MAIRPKGREDDSDKPMPLDFTHYYSETSKNRVANKIKEFYKFMMIPGIGNLAGGASALYLPIRRDSYRASLHHLICTYCIIRTHH